MQIFLRSTFMFAWNGKDLIYNVIVDHWAARWKYLQKKTKCLVSNNWKHLYTVGKLLKVFGVITIISMIPVENYFPFAKY